MASAQDLAFILGTNAVEATTLAELFTSTTKDQLFERLLASFRSRGFPTTDWIEGAGYRSLAEAQADALSDFAAPEEGNAARLQTIAASGFVGFAKGLWLKVLAYQLYQLLFQEATRTTATVKLTAAPGVGPVTIANRALVFECASGNRYVGPTEAGPLILPLAGTLSITVESEFPNASLGNPSRNYVDASGTLTRMITTVPGVTASNPAPDFSPVSQLGISTGSITPSRTVPGNPVVPTTIAILITASGQVAAASWSLALNGGAFVNQGTVPVTYDIPATNIRLTFANGALVPSFVLASSFTLQAPGTWILTQGTDEETDEVLADRCRARWPALSDVPNEDVYALWARSSTTQITQVLVTPNATIPGRVDIVIAGQAGALPQSVIDIAQAYIDARHAITDFPVVQSAVSLVIVLAGTVTVRSEKTAIAQQEAQANVATAVAVTGIGGKLRLAELTEQIMAADGVIDLSGLTINGFAANLQLGALQVGSFTQVLATGLTWIPG
jgi:hypothetical protein